ncbi:MAG: class I SAM-dependent methyltransferase [Candidatus Doudnabacteria bacterium]|nr:class I SAM-dependent methyltransferase [Candidatus Doudnabacteria bacterium]
MNNAYQAADAAIKYLDFLNSIDGKIQQQVLSREILRHLPQNPQTKILDAACGSGWLAGHLQKSYPGIEACDSSPLLIKFAQTHFPKIPFAECGLEKPLPYPANNFDAIILNMAAPDLENLSLAFKNLSVALKPKSSLIITIPNPEFTSPAAVWHRSLADVIFWRKPKLIFKKPPSGGTKFQRYFGNSKIPCFYYTMENYLLAAGAAGLKLKQKTEITSAQDSKKFDLNYKLFRYPLFLLLEFVKIGQ